MIMNISRASLNYFIYRDNEVKICFEGTNIFIDSIKPIFSFDYDELVYEPLESFQNKFIIYNGYTIPLEKRHIDEIETYLARFIKNDIDFEVYVYDKNKHNLFKEVMFKKEADKLKLKYLTSKPVSLLSKAVAGKWEPIVAIIMENGSCNLNPVSICDLCLLLFTQQEWDNHPKPNNQFETWNFVLEKWEDTESIESIRHSKLVELNKFILDEILNKELEIKGIYYCNWNQLLNEANEYKNNNNIIGKTYGNLKTNMFSISEHVFSISESEFYKNILDNETIFQSSLLTVQTHCAIITDLILLITDKVELRSIEILSLYFKLKDKH